MLIVDDSGFSRSMIKKSLPVSWDIQIAEAGNGLEAVAALQESGRDVVFLDLTMPELDGYGVLEWMRDNGVQASVIVLSADIQPQAEQRVKELGALAFVKKPFSKASLADVLAKCGLHNE